MDYVFTPANTIRYWLQQTQHNHTVIEDLDLWAQQPGRLIAAFELLELGQDVAQQIQTCCDMADTVILFVTEFIDDAWCRRFDRDNVVFFVCGKLNWQLRHARCRQCLYFFWSTCDFYRRYPDFLCDLDGTKDLGFDALLGRRKPHRDLLFQGLDCDSNIVTYFPAHEQDIRSYSDSQFAWPSEVLPRPQEPVAFTVQAVQVDGVVVSLSQIIPRQIYQRTRYSLVAETESHNGWSFFTEKITKPILAQRLFLVMSGQHYLANLRSLGFQTFDGVVDESYDQEPDLPRRAAMVLEQVNSLAQRDYHDVQRRIRPVLEHNHAVMFKTDWQASMIRELAEILRK